MTCKDNCIYGEMCYRRGVKASSSPKECPKFQDNANYRKASEVAAEIFAEIERNMVVIDDVDFNRFRAIGARTFAEIKKKYTEAYENDGI